MIFIVGAFSEPQKVESADLNFIDSWEDEKNVYFCGLIKDETFLIANCIMLDKYGKSILRDIRIDNSEFEFTKKYLHRKDIINYKYKKKNGFWNGHYSGPIVGEGKTICKLVMLEKSWLELENAIIF